MPRPVSQTLRLARVFAALQVDRQLPLRPLAHGIERVGDQVDDDLFQANRVADHVHRLFGNRELQGHVLLSDAIVDQAECVANRSGEVRRLLGRSVLAGERLEMLSQRPHAGDDRRDKFQIRQGRVLVVSVQQHARAGDVGRHRGERLVDLVGATPASACPRLAILVACTRLSCARRRSRSVLIRSLISADSSEFVAASSAVRSVTRCSRT